MTTFRTIYENGVLRPLEPVDLPERCLLRFENWKIIGHDEDGRPEYKVAAFILGVAPEEPGDDHF
jgi:hypothetical protein